MPVYTEDLTIMGNGVIGSLTAVLAARAGLKVALCGPLSRPGSASVAAGAMLNVYGEIDGTPNDYVVRKLRIGRDAIARWRQILPPEVFTADHTLVCTNGRASTFEHEAFNAIKRASGGAPTKAPIPAGIQARLTLRDEPAIDTRALFQWLEDQLRQTVRLLPNNTWQAGPMSIAPKTLWAVGAQGSNPTVVGPVAAHVLPVFYGIGTAMHLTGAEIDMPARTVLRTPNRGNTCGVHIVPRKDGHYVGAGSFISRTPQSGVRLETIQYLTQCIQKDFGADIWRATVEPVVGWRPVSLDGKPMLGPLKLDPTTYVATGTKRDGLTYAPIIADDIIRWASGTERTVVFAGWEPDREPISYGSFDDCQAAYVANRQAALQEHGRSIATDAAEREYRDAHGRACTEYGLDLDFGLHPEIVGIFQ